MERELRTQSRGNNLLLTPSVEQLEDTLEPGAHDTYVGKTVQWKHVSGDIQDVAGWWPEAKEKVKYLLQTLKGDNPAVKELRRRVAALPADQPLRVRYRYCRATTQEGCLWLETAVKNAVKANLNSNDGEGTSTAETSGLGGPGWVYILEFLDWERQS